MATIDNAIIMAAGKGTRMRPLTLQKPKPLVPVNGVPMIETIINGLHQNGINDITVVVGYLSDHFQYLVKKYDGLKLINNPYYSRYNNISSLYVARNELKNTVILDGDQWLRNPDVLTRHFESSGYAGVPIRHFVDEWIMHTNSDGEVTSCDRDGNDHGWRLYSLSKWTQKDSQRLKECLINEFEKKHHYDIYWDDIAMFDYFDDFHLRVMPIGPTDIVEIDSLDQLKEVNEKWGSSSF